MAEEFLYDLGCTLRASSSDAHVWRRSWKRGYTRIDAIDGGRSIFGSGGRGFESLRACHYLDASYLRDPAYTGFRSTSGPILADLASRALGSTRSQVQFSS